MKTILLLPLFVLPSILLWSILRRPHPQQQTRDEKINNWIDCVEGYITG